MSIDVIVSELKDASLFENKIISCMTGILTSTVALDPITGCMVANLEILSMQVKNSFSSVEKLQYATIHRHLTELGLLQIPVSWSVCHTLRTLQFFTTFKNKINNSREGFFLYFLEQLCAHDCAVL